MNAFVEERAVMLGKYIVETGSTVRFAAQKFSVSKSTVHTDVSQRLKYIDKDLFDNVRKVLDENKSQRHIRGGMATKEKYLMARKKNSD